LKLFSVLQLIQPFSVGVAGERIQARSAAEGQARETAPEGPDRYPEWWNATAQGGDRDALEYHLRP